MYSDEDVNSAVAAGAISADAATALRAHVSAIRHMPRGDEENFRLITSFNDVFVTIGAIIMLVAAGAIGEAVLPSVNGPSPLAGALVAATAWGLAEFFTRKRRMALPSIILLLAFVGGVFFTQLGVIAEVADNDNERLAAALVAVSALITAGMAWLHWRRFMVPITVAAGAVAVGGSVIALVAALLMPAFENNAEQIIIPLVFAVGLAIFTFAMRWDASDRARTTRRSDVAFWLHLAAAPMLAHPLFHWLGVTDGGNIGVGAAAGVLLVYIVMGIMALAIDRRALLVSALAYVLIALTFLFDKFGAVELNFALTALVIGSALLTLSAFWTPMRRIVVEKLPAQIQDNLPEAHLLPAE